MVVPTMGYVHYRPCPQSHESSVFLPSVDLAVLTAPALLLGRQDMNVPMKSLGAGISVATLLVRDIVDQIFMEHPGELHDRQITLQKGSAHALYLLSVFSIHDLGSFG